MTEQISTPDVTTVTDTSSVDVPETTSTNEVVTDTTQDSQEPETGKDTAEIKQKETTQEEPKLYAGKYKSVEELVKGYEESQKYVNKYADLEKEYNQLKASTEPKIIDENGQIDKNFEKDYKFNVDNEEFLYYEQLSKGLELETRKEVEEILQNAKRLYFADKNAYESALDSVKTYFSPKAIEKATLWKDKALAQMQNKFEEAKQAQKLERGKNLVAQVREYPELENILDERNENYIPELFGVFKDIFETHGQVDVKSFNDTVNKLKELGKKEYIASLEREKTKEQAKVPSGNIVSQNSSMPTREELIANPKLYREAVNKFGMESIDKIIMKG